MTTLSMTFEGLNNISYAFIDPVSARCLCTSILLRHVVESVRLSKVNVMRCQQPFQ